MSSAPKAPGCACEYKLALSMKQSGCCSLRGLWLCARVLAEDVKEMSECGSLSLSLECVCVCVGFCAVVVVIVVECGVVEKGVDECVRACVREGEGERERN